MTNKDYTHLGLVVDRSGSMGTIAKDMIGGIDSLFKDQAKLPGKCLVDYAMFDSQYELVFENVDVADARAQLNPRGTTALLDAIGKTIVALGEKFATMNEDDRPSLVQVVVVTDGYENSSSEWTKTRIAELIAQQRDVYGWDIIFLGANMDAVAEGGQMGYDAGQTLTYTATAGGASAMMASTSQYITRSRNAGTAKGNAFSDSDRQNATDSE